MTLHYPETDAAPTTYSVHPPAGETTTETIVPVYARKPARSSPKKKLLWIAPAAVALGVGVWAMTLGEQSRDDANLADTDGLTTSRLSATQTEPPAAPAPLAVQATPTPDAVAPAAAPSLRPAPAPAPVRAAAPVRRSSATSTRRAAPRPAAAPAAADAAPAAQETLGPVIIETTPAPPTVAPVPPLPVEPTPQVTPPATTTPPGPGGA